MGELRKGSSEKLTQLRLAAMKKTPTDAGGRGQGKTSAGEGTAREKSPEQNGRAIKNIRSLYST